jgi:hypothetical protein
MTDDVHSIALSRTKLVLLTFGSVGFAMIGAWMLTFSDEAITLTRRLGNPTVFRAVAVIALVFGIAIGIFGVRKLFDQQPGLVFTAAGIVDNSSGVAAGFIPWADITGFTVYQIHRTRMLVVQVRDVERYISRGNPVKRTLNRANAKMVGSPISIASSSLRINFNELLALAERYHAKHARAA